MNWLGGCLVGVALSVAACGSDKSGAAAASGGATGTGGATNHGGATNGTGGKGTTMPITTGDVFGTVHTGSYNLGPVDYAETQYHNACAPKEKYPAQIQAAYGPYLAGVDNSVGGDGSLCDACALVTSRLGKSVLVHIVTYGVSKAPGNLDLSPEAYDAIYESDPQGTPDVPRPMTWQLARCESQGNIIIEYQTGSNPYWTSFWVRNGKLPITAVGTKASSENSYSVLTRTPDGPFTDSNGVGTGSFAIQISGSDGTVQMLNQTFTTAKPGSIVETTMQFQ